MKAVERPQQWHEENARRYQNEKATVYLVFYEDDGDEYNAYFPLSREGKQQAERFARKNYSKVLKTTTQVRFLPIPNIRKGNEHIYEQWGL